MVVPVLRAAVRSSTPVAGDDLTCTFINTPRTVDIAVTKTSAVTEVVKGGVIDYTVTVAHLTGSVAADGAVVHDTPGACVSACLVTGCTPNGSGICPATPGDLLGTGGAAIPLLPPGGRVAFTVRGVAD